MVTIKQAEEAWSCNIDISDTVYKWANFRRHVGEIRIVGWDSEGHGRDFRMPASAIAEAVRIRLQADIDDLTQKIADLGITPETIELATMPELVERATRASDVAVAC